MPLGIERINVRRRRPNPLINFITPLKDNDEAISKDYLERIAAIVYPIMKANGLEVMTLDEFPPNREFWGRNFNAGECIQLVLKHPSSRQWLPFTFVQGVMIHELAHIKQMNHSRAFWAVRNGYAVELAKLHEKRYTGEGFWSTGRNLLSEVFTQDRVLAEGEGPTNLCGGTYRSRARRRKTGPKEKLSYAEQKRRRIERKFGSAEGEKIGADEEKREELVGGKQKAAPRVANSKRGRELRAAAALSRFDKQDESEKEEESESDEEEKAENVGDGQMLVPVSRNQDGRKAKEEMQREMELLGGCCGTGSELAPIVIDLTSDDEEKPQLPVKSIPSSSRDTRPPTNNPLSAKPLNKFFATKSESDAPKPPIANPPDSPKLPEIKLRPLPPKPSISTCSVCSVANPPSAITCEVCLNVLDPASHTNWKCTNPSCSPSYRNPEDYKFCGVCNERRAAI